MVGRRDLIRKGAGAIAAAGIGAGVVANNGSAQAIEKSNGLGSGDPKHIGLLVLDRSGSMSAVKDAVVESVNNFLNDQKNNHGMYVGAVQFDSMKTADGGFCEPIFSFTAVDRTPRLAQGDYQPRGSTPLLAAIAEAIGKLEQVVRPIDRALLIVQTDGLENASPKEITRTVIKDLIKSKEEQGNWTFVFLGADIDAWAEGGSLGVYAGSTAQYANTASDTKIMYATVSNRTANWYASTAGGLSVDAAASAPANLNATFFIDPGTTTAPDISNTGLTFSNTTEVKPKRVIRAKTKKTDPGTA